MGYSRNGYVCDREYERYYTHPECLWMSLRRTFRDLENPKALRGATAQWVLKKMCSNRRYGIKDIKEGEFDVFHPTYYDPYFLKELGDRSFVLTIYDMIHERFSAEGGTDRTITNKRRLAERADRIIAISESTKKDVVELLNVPASKVYVTHLAGSIAPPKDGERPKSLPRRYMVQVGNRAGYKNFAFMLDALEEVFERDPDMHLVCVGGVPFTAEERIMIERSRGRGRIIRVSVPDDELALIFSNALVYINPSQYEGFGIPLLEAMTCGCPTLVCRVSSLPEVGGSASRYFELNDRDSFLDALTPILEDEGIRDKMRHDGQDQAAYVRPGRRRRE